MSQIGVRDLYYSVLKKDDETGIEYDTPKRILGLTNMTLDPQISEGRNFGDDHLTESYSQISSVNVEFGINELTDEDRAKLFGYVINEEGVTQEGNDNTIPYIALAFRSKKGNNKFKYYWLYKGKLSYGQEQFEGTKDSIEYQNDTVKGVFQCRDNDGYWRGKTDEDNKNYKPSIGRNWFKQVYKETIETKKAVKQS